MIPEPKTPARWSGGRLGLVIAVLFVVQMGLIWLFGGRPHWIAAARPPHAVFNTWPGDVSEEQLMRAYFVGDPDVFLTPTAHGFSGRAWLNEPPPQYHPTNQLEQPVWLAFSAPSTGGLSHQALTADLAANETLARLDPVPDTEPLPVFLPPRVISTDSVFSIEGGVADRLATPAPSLRNWPGSAQTPLLTNSVVQIAVTQAGDVIAARLATRSGSADADADALAKARSLEFRPAAQPGVRWANAVFQWHTALETNTATH